jgi:hypothetical protein
MVADVGPPLVLMAIGLVLWLAVTASVSGISIQAVGAILFVCGAIWLVIELLQSRAPRGRAPIVEERPVYRERRFWR